MNKAKVRLSRHVGIARCRLGSEILGELDEYNYLSIVVGVSADSYHDRETCLELVWAGVHLASTLKYSTVGYRCR